MKQNRPLFKRDNNQINGDLFSITNLMPQIVIIAIVVAAYYYITSRGLFPNWTKYVYYGAKYFIGLEVLMAGVKSLTGPLIAIGVGLLNLFLLQIHHGDFMSVSSSWQLIFIGVVAALLTFVVRSLPKN